MVMMTSDNDNGQRLYKLKKKLRKLIISNYGLVITHKLTSVISYKSINNTMNISILL